MGGANLNNIFRVAVSSTRNNVSQASWYHILLCEKFPTCSGDVAGSCKEEAVSLGFTAAFEGDKVYQEGNHGKSETGFLSKTSCAWMFLSVQVLAPLSSLVVMASCLFCDTYPLYILHFILYVFIFWVLDFETLICARYPWQNDLKPLRVPLSGALTLIHPSFLKAVGSGGPQTN